ncbi:hypothetical protein VIGAN_02020000 [Vigna angularis var. angularis]|uniref:HMG box domain-containing protein n=1 Tax=Vigna angularis var. angularis TaxID=157739 RepID=A0A0S3RAS5_PHAAN|nr:hypothetical protein VIGAN_02020000 [Vigna angularis var. angularis]
MKGGKSKTESKRGDAKLAVNKKGAPAKARKPAGKGKAAKDPNKPKRPPSAFFVFMEEFRKQFNKEHPDNKAVSAVGKAAGAKWKSMSDAEKAPYVAKSEKRKVEYEKSMRAYNKKQVDVYLIKFFIIAILSWWHGSLGLLFIVLMCFCFCWLMSGGRSYWWR